MKKIIIICILTSFFCYTLSYSSDHLAKIYQIIKSKPKIRISLLNDYIQVISIYKQQIISIYESRNLTEADRISHFINAVYFPYQGFWNSFFDENGFKTWVKKNWENLQNTKTPGFLIPFEVDFDSLFVKTVSKVKNLTSRELQGKWYLVYGNRAAGMGGFGNGIMFVDFFGIGDDGPEDLIFTLPHEINHQIFEESNKDDGTLLYSIIDEGFACYVNYIYWDKKYSTAKNINFTEEEWKWCIDNEKKIFNYSKALFYSKDKNVIHKFQRAHQHIWDGAPDRIAYFIGFRICEAYVNKNGKDSWKNIYELPLSKTLELSDYEDIINK